MGPKVCFAVAMTFAVLSACYGNPPVGALTHVPVGESTTTGGVNPNMVPAPIGGAGNGPTADSNFQFLTGAQWGNDLVGSAWTNGDASPRYVGDFNGDGKADIVGMDANNTYLGLSTGTAFAPVAMSPCDYPASRAWTSQNTMPRMQGDVNGDGILDFVGFGGGVWIDDGTPSGFVADNTSWSTEFFGGAWTDESVAPRFAADVNGDGKADAIGIDPNGVHVALSTGSAFSPSTVWSTDFVTSLGWTQQDSTPRFVGDFNGDGKADLLGFGVSSVIVGVSTGTAFQSITVSTEFTGAAWTSQNETPRFVADVNGDGKADLVGINASGVHVAFSDGTKAKPAILAFRGLNPNDGWTSQNATPRFLEDVNGDKKADILGFGPTAVQVYLAP